MAALGAIGMIAALFLFVMAHEAGHFIAAKLTKMKVTEFFFGFGPRLWSTRRGETEYGVKAVPAGGYVRIIGMNPYEEVDPADLGRTYREKKFWEKAFVVLAGVAINFGLGFLILWGLFGAYGDLAVVTSTREVSVEANGEPTPALEAGIEVGDTILEIGGAPIETWEDLEEAVAPNPGETVDIVVQRGTETITLEATLAEAGSDGEPKGFLGVSPDVVEVDFGVFGAAGRAGEEVGTLTKLSFEFLWSMVAGIDDLARALFTGSEVAVEQRPTSVVGLAQIGAQSTDIGVGNLLYILASLNIVLGTLNVLPLFPLDGGHFAVALVERITRREVDVRRLVPVAAAVIVLFVFFGVVAVYLDIAQPFDFANF